MPYKKEVHEHASETLDAIMRLTDRKIWRTRRRIYELILEENSIVQENPFMGNQNMFLFLIMGLTSSGEVQFELGKNIYSSGERWEEGESEATLFTDLDESTNEPYVTTVEQYFHEGLKAGLIITEIRQAIQQNLYRVRSRIKEVGVSPGNIFYKYPTGSNSKKEVELPKLPAYI